MRLACVLLLGLLTLLSAPSVHAQPAAQARPRVYRQITPSIVANRGMKLAYTGAPLTLLAGSLPPTGLGASRYTAVSRRAASSTELPLVGTMQRNSFFPPGIFCAFVLCIIVGMGLVLYLMMRYVPRTGVGPHTNTDSSYSSSYSSYSSYSDSGGGGSSSSDSSSYSDSGGGGGGSWGSSDSSYSDSGGGGGGSWGSSSDSGGGGGSSDSGGSSSSD